MFDLIPAIDLLDGKLVRLHQGNYDQITTYGHNPVSVAESFAEAGAHWIHVVDLNAARSGIPRHQKEIEDIIKHVTVNVQVGGGIRSQEVAEEYLQLGAGRIVLGSSAVENPQLLSSLLSAYSSRIAVGVDAKDGLVLVRGWEARTQLKATDFALALAQSGVRTLIYTDVARDGSLAGPNLKSLEEFLGAVSVTVIASGGVGSVEDVVSVRALQKNYPHLSGLITGKALYDGRIRLRDALEALQ